MADPSIVFVKTEEIFDDENICIYMERYNICICIYIQRLRAEWNEKDKQKSNPPTQRWIDGWKIKKRKSYQNLRKKVKWVEIRGSKEEIENKKFVTGARNQKYCC